MAKSSTAVADEAMSAPAEARDGGKAKAGGKRKLMLPLLLALLLGGGGAAYMMGLPARLMGGGAQKPAEAEAAPLPGSVDLPEIIANLNPGSKRTAFVKLKVKLELSNKADQPHVHEAEGRLLDLFQTYLRDMRPEELRGSAGIYRLREELISRANLAVAPARITDILFLEMLIQ